MVEVSDVLVGSRRVSMLRNFDNQETVKFFADECAESDESSFKLGQHPPRVDIRVGHHMWQLYGLLSFISSSTQRCRAV